MHETCNILQQAKNGGQIARAVLEDAEIDCKRFFTSRNVQTGTPRARRRLLRTVNRTAVPQHLRVCTLKKKAEEKYQLGLVAKPVNIVPRSYKQIFIKHDSVTTKVNTIYGQNVNLHRLLKLFCENNKHLLAASHVNPATMP